MIVNYVLLGKAVPSYFILLEKISRANHERCEWKESRRGR